MVYRISDRVLRNTIELRIYKTYMPFPKLIAQDKFPIQQISATLLSFLLIASAKPRPPQILEVFPAEKSTQPSVEFVGAVLNFQLGENAGPHSIQLFVNEVDVTKQSRRGGTRDWPPSHYVIRYTPSSLQPGKHTAELRFQTTVGTKQSYSWSFSIKSP